MDRIVAASPANRGRESAPEESAPARAFDPARLRRAAQLAVQRIGATTFAVRGQEEPYYYVDLAGDLPCACKDAEFHGSGCKHELAARLANGDMPLVMALGEMLLRAERARENT
jgi:hypothetical protein